MFKDFSGSFVIIKRRNKIRTSQRKYGALPKEFFPATKPVLNTIAAMLLVTLIIGISSTIWYGLQVQVALDQIGSSRATNNELHNENKLLLAQRDLLLTQDHIEAAAQKLGLKSPAKKQLRYP
ncbi:MAG: hypothetical protein AMJ60_02335 [Desulfobacterales bacterium SG8_35]|nr:MAG: hypothetical protein AMJ60_02335 [Desulfobacterales bacterium SG8_35]